MLDPVVSPEEIMNREVVLDPVVSPEEIMSREVVLDPVVSPEEIMSREVELDPQVSPGFRLFLNSGAMDIVFVTLPKHGS